MAGLGIILMFVLCMSLQVKSTKYTFSKDKGNSTSARELCSLATPNIIYDKDGNTVEVKSTDVDGNPESEQQVWIGYAQIYASFLYVGCSDLDILPKPRKHSNMPKDPGQCYSRCNTTFVGIEENKCSCISEVQLQKLNTGTCDKKCSFSDHTLCGKNNQGVSIYMKVTYHQGSKGENERDKACRAVDQANSVYMWEPCSKRLGYICQNGPYNNSNGYTPYDVSNRWDDNMKYCLRHNKYPPDESPGTMRGLSDKWIGRIRSFIIIDSKDASGYEPGFHQGYLQYEKGEVKIKFETVSGVLRGLCDVLPVTTPQTTTSTTTSTTSTTTATPQTTTTLTTTSTTSTTTATTELTTITTSLNSSNEGHSMHRQSDNKDNTGLVAVYVIVPIVLILIAVLVVFLLWRRRTSTTTKTTGSMGQEKSHHIVGNGVTNSSYEKTIVPNSETDYEVNHDYLVLENTNEYAEIKTIDLDQSVGEDYDTTNNGHAGTNGRTSDSGNVYNTLENIGDETYNHTTDDNSRFDDTYNRVEHEESYNTAGSVITGRKQAYEDDYSHTGETF